MVLTGARPRAAKPGRRQRAGLHQPGARAGQGGQAAQRLRLPDRPGQRPGRARARPEGRPAARLPQDRQPGASRAQSPRSGAVDRTRCPRPGLSAYELLDALGATAVSRAAGDGLEHRWSPRPTRRTSASALRALDFLVVADFFLSETARIADVVLPVAQWAEEDGTMTNLEGRVLLRRRAKPPPAGVWTDVADPERARRRGSARGSHFSATTAEVFAELPAAPQRRRRRLHRHQLRTHRRRGRRVLALPVAATTRARRACSSNAFATADGRAPFHPVEHRGPAEIPDGTTRIS